MARWIRFEQVDGTPLLVNTDAIIAALVDASRPNLLSIKTEFGEWNVNVKGDIESLTLMLGAETFA